MPIAPARTSANVVPFGRIPIGVQPPVTAAARLAELTRTAVGLNAGF